MSAFPFLLDADEAIEYFNQQAVSDAEKAYAVGVMSKDGMSNRAIREATGIKKVYEVTHLIRVGIHLSEEELALWHDNPKKITFGHVRAVALLPRQKREEMLRSLLIATQSVRRFEGAAKGDEEEQVSDVARYARIMEEVLGRSVKIRYDDANKVGSITLDFYTLDDLDDLSKGVGFNAEEHL